MTEFVLANLTIATATVAQRATGLGFSLIAVPLLVFLYPDAVPAALLILLIPLNVGMLASDWRSCDRRALARMLLGRIAGTVAVSTVMVGLSDRSLSLLIGGTVLTLVALAAVGERFAVGPTGYVVIGVVSGVAGTVAASGGTPLALALHDRPGPVLRATIAPVLLLGVVVSLAALSLTGHLVTADAGRALALAPGLALGMAVGAGIASYLDGRRGLRPLLLLLGFAGGVSVIARALAG